MRTCVSAVLLISIVPCLVFGQGGPLSSLEQGARIRLIAETVPESERVGRLVSISMDSIQFRPDSHSVTRSISLKSVRTLEVSRETRTRRSQYAAVAAIIGGVIGYVANNHNGQSWIGTGKADASQNALVGGIAGVALGGGLGWRYGGKKVQNWHPVDR